MRAPLVAAATLAVGIGASLAAWAKAPPAVNDVSITMKVAGGDTVGPLCTLKVKNAGTSPQNGVVLKIHAESENGVELWSGTVDLAAKKTGSVQARVYLDATTTCLVATATLPAAVDEHPDDNAARVALVVKGKAAGALIGRAIHLGFCAACHDTAYFTGKTTTQILTGANDPARGMGVVFNATDVKNLCAFYLDPAGVILPPSLPAPPVGGWPTYAGSVKALLDDRCVNCHGPSLAQAGVWLNTYTAATKASGRVLVDVKSGKMPQTGPRFTQTEVALLQDWITGGLRP